MPSIEDLREFLVLAEHLNFSSAAESLFITQPALSRHIASLENELDVKLFNRTTKNVELTEPAKFFRTHIRTLVHDYDEILRRLNDYKESISSHLIISCPYNALQTYLGNIPELFGSSYPEIKLSYNVGIPETTMQYLLDGKADIAIVAQFQSASDNHLAQVEMFDEPIGVLMNCANPLALKQTISAEDLTKYPLLMVGKSAPPQSWNYMNSILNSYGVTLPSPILFDQIEGMIMALRQNEGVALLGSHLINQTSDKIVFRPVSNPSMSRPVSLFYNPSNNNEAISIFIDFYKKYFKYPFSFFE